MRHLIILAALVSLEAGAPAAAADAVRFALDVHQQDSAAGAVLLYSDTATVVRGVAAAGFALAFSAEVEVTAADTAHAQFLVHAVTLGPSARTYARSYSAEYGLPARIEGIEGKGGGRLMLTVTPLAFTDFDTAQCLFDHRVTGAYKIQPSASLDVHYVPNSFGDYYIEAFKGVLEHHYRQFQEVFQFSLPGKFSIFLLPCASPAVLWDTRYGQVTDPTRSTAFAIAANGQNTVDPFIATHTALLRSWGYAPPFLSEGAANYTSFALFDMKKLAAEGRVPPLDSLLDTYAYLTAAPLVADRASATFAQYLIDSYGLEAFRALYVSADDLNLRRRLALAYGKGIGALEAEWRAYVDTSTIRFPALAQEADKAEALFQYGRMRDYARAMLELAPGRIDSAFAWSRLKQAEFMLGNYYGAADAAEAQVQLDGERAVNWMTLGSFQMMNGMYAEARASLQNGQSKDPSDQTIAFNRALAALYTSDTATAESLLVEIITRPESRAPQGEARVVLGEILLSRGDKRGRDRAATYFVEAMQTFQQQLSVNRTMPTAYLWLGAAALGMGDTELARDALETGLFLESRPFYLGQMNLWLGKTADVLGDHGLAQEYYGQVLAGSSAAYAQQEIGRAHV